MSYIHGISASETNTGPASVRTTDTGVIALIGCAPSGPQEELVVVKSKKDAAQFGGHVDGYTIPQALTDIFAQSKDSGTPTVIVVNVTDDVAHFDDNDTGSITDEAVTTAAGVATLQFAIKPTTLITLTNSAGTTTYTAGVEYSVSGNTITILDLVTIPNGTDLLVDYTTEEQVNVSGMQAQLQHPPQSVSGVSTLVIKSADLATTYVENTDYTVDQYGLVTFLATGAISEGDSLQATYKWFNSTNVVAADIIGTISGTTYTGTKLYAKAVSTKNLKPKIFCVPTFLHLTGVAAEMQSLADTYSGVCLLDSVAGWTPTNAIDGRGLASTTLFNTSHDRTILCYPGVYALNLGSNEQELRPLSPFVAGLMSVLDTSKGYWFSPSNQKLNGVLGLETEITWDYTSPSGTDANNLNAVGIVTVGTGFGTGYLVWGGRLANYPTETGITSHISVRRTADSLIDSVKKASLPFIDKPITDAIIDAIRETVNGYIRSLIQKGALVEGSRCIYDPNENPPADIAAGILKFDIQHVPPPPLEELRYRSIIDTTLLNFD